MHSITLCGSMQFIGQMHDIAKKLQARGYHVYVPEGVKKAENYRDKIRHDYIRKHYKLIKRSSGILVVNLSKKGIPGYIGANSLMEIGFAHVLNKDIFLLNKPSKGNFGYEEILASQPVILKENLDNIDSYYKSRPLSYVASTNLLKIEATDSAFRRLGIKSRWIGVSVESGISGQPLTLDETYQGALNRLKNLENTVTNREVISTEKARNYEYLVAIESGNQEYKGKLYGLSVVAIKYKDRINVGIVWDPAIPKSFLELVPSKYPDFGVLVQKEYGIAEKDPYIYLAKGELSRFDFLQDAVIRAVEIHRSKMI